MSWRVYVLGSMSPGGKCPEGKCLGVYVQGGFVLSPKRIFVCTPLGYSCANPKIHSGDQTH